MADRLFLSHSSDDAEAARDLRVALEAAGYTCWMAPDDVDGTGSWAEQILSAIEQSDAMLILISTSANRSPHVSREVNLALSRKRPVFPIRIENVPPEASLEYLLSLVQRVDAFPPPISDHAPRIIRRLEATLRKTGRPASESGTAIAGAQASGAAPQLAPTEPLVAAGSAASADDPVAARAEAPPLPPPDSSAVAGTGVLPAGTRVGAFTVESVLGQGGMATVYRATQEEPRRPVALKVIRADHAADPLYRQRFLTEKDTLAALEHPSIVPIYAAGEANGVLYIAMRLVDGPDLAGRLERLGKMTLAETVAVLRPIADAVDYAHESGIVHRDLKPSNIILDRRDRPYLSDFGLGKQLDKSRGLSAPGIALGTLTYMAPEQFTGLTDPALAGRVDVYALACVAYTCLTGSPPFDGGTPERTMYAHLHEPLPNRPGLSDTIETVLRKALAKNPADRFASAADFITTLAATQTITELQTVPVIPPPRRGMGAWARANSALAASIVTLLTVVSVSAGVIIFNPTAADSTATPGPAGTQGVVASAPIFTMGPPPSVPPTIPPSTIPPETEPPETKPPPTRTPTPPDPTQPPDISGPLGGTIVVKDKSGAPAGYTTSKGVTVRIDKSPSDKGSGICSRAFTSSAKPPSGSSSAWKTYDGGTGSYSYTLPTSTYGVHTVYAWFRDCSSRRNVSSTIVKDTIKFDHAPVVTVNGDCNVHQYVDLPGVETRYWVSYTTNCITDPDGNAVTIKFGPTTYGTWVKMTETELSANCAVGDSCLWYKPNQPWGGGAYNDAFYLWGTDSIGVKSTNVLVTLCVNQSACP